MNANDEIIRRMDEQPASTPANVRALVERLAELEREHARLRRQLENVSALVPYWQRQLEETRNGNSLIALMRKADLVDLKMALQAGAEGGRE